MTPTIEHLRALLGTIDYRALAEDIALDMPGAGAASLEPGRGNEQPDNHATRDQRQALADHNAIAAATARAYTAVMAVAAIQARRLPTREAGRTEPPPQAKACALHVRCTGEALPVWRKSDMANHLDTPFSEPTPLCSACFDFIRKHRRTPSKDELRHYSRTGRWIVRVKPHRAA